MPALKEGDGDPQRGAVTPHGITARTVETAQPDSTGDPHHTTSPIELIVSDPLWPLVVVLGDIARRASTRVSDQPTGTSPN